jgi:hypothetical protein
MMSMNDPHVTDGSRNSSPEEVLLAALSARDAHDHERVTALTDPESIRERFENFCDAHRPMTLERFAKQTAIAPEHLSESYDRWMKAGGDNTTSGLRELGVATHAELVALGPQQFFTRWSAGHDHGADIVRRLRSRGREVPPALLGTPPGVEYAVIGAVHEAPDLVHVLYRVVWQRGQSTESRGPLVHESLRRQSNGAWRLLAGYPPFLESYGPQVVTILPEEYVDLYTEEELRGGGPQESPRDKPAST